MTYSNTCNAHVRLFISGFEHKINEKEIVLQSKQSKLEILESVSKFINKLL